MVSGKDSKQASILGSSFSNGFDSGGTGSVAAVGISEVDAASMVGGA